jgi:O-antigen ligase
VAVGPKLAPANNSNNKVLFVKWILFAIALAGVLPLAGWLRRNRRHRPKIWMLLGSLPFLLTALPRLEIALIGWPAWPGHAKGIEISGLDVLTLAIYLSLPRSRHPLPFRISMACYFAVVMLSATQAQVPFAALFYLWQLARVFLLYAVVTRACAREVVAPSLLKGMAIGLCFQAGVVIWERFGLGAIQTVGTFGHQNLLGLVSHFVVFPFFALLLAGERSWWPAITPVAGGIIAALTASRATIALFAGGLAAVFVLSSARTWTAQKAKVLFLVAICFAISTPLAIASLERRFTAAPLAADYDERERFVEAASMMIQDKPFGVGANNFGVVNNAGRYAERAGIAWTSRAALVHNIYWLALAETGYVGLVALVVLLLCPLIVALRCGWRYRKDRRGDLMIGFATSLMIVYVHSYFEWVLFGTQAQYLFAMTLGLIAGLAQQLGYFQPRQSLLFEPINGPVRSIAGNRGQTNI